VRSKKKKWRLKRAIFKGGKSGNRDSPSWEKPEKGWQGEKELLCKKQVGLKKRNCGAQSLAEGGRPEVKKIEKRKGKCHMRLGTLRWWKGEQEGPNRYWQGGKRKPCQEKKTSFSDEQGETTRCS